jgi:hypothetical protein
MTSLPRQVFGFTLAEVRITDSRGRRRNQYRCVCNACGSAVWKRVADVDRAEANGVKLNCRACYQSQSKNGIVASRFCGTCGKLPHRVVGAYCAACGLKHDDEEPLERSNGWDRNGCGEVWWT